MAVELEESAWSLTLPRYLTRFTGRERELVELDRLLSHEGERLVTIVGTGGVGKTRLMVEALARYASRPRTTEFRFIDGAAIERPEDVLPAIAAQLDLEQQGDETSGGLVSELLADRTMFLALDNLEHLADSALDLALLLRACPGLRILATSRTPLRLSGECLVALEPLETAGSEERWSAAAILFLDRAKLANATLEIANTNRATVEAICAQLDGLPLAIELAAARLRILSLDALLALLTNQLAVLGGGPIDSSKRHQTLRAAIAWSVALLGEEDRNLYCQLGVFPDSFSLEAVESVGFGELTSRQRSAAALDRLSSLFDQGLIQSVSSPVPGQVRFRMLVSIREAALELLTAEDQLDPTTARMARHFERFVAEQSAELIGPGQAEAMVRLAAESAGIGAAIDWASQQREDEIGPRLIAGLWRFWANRGLLFEGRGHIDRVLAGRTSESTPDWAAALRGAAVIAELQTDWHAALSWGTAAIEIWEELGDEANLSRSWVDYGNVQSSTGALAQARLAYEQAAIHAATAQDQRMETVARCSIGTVALRQGRPEEADAQFARALSFLRQLGDKWLLAMTLSNRAIAQCRIGQSARAMAGVQECLLIRRELGDEPGIGYALLILEEAGGDSEIGGACAREALEIAQRLGVQDLSGSALTYLAVADLRRQDFRSAAANLGDALRNSLDAGNPIFVSEVIELIAELVESAEPAAAARFLGGSSEARKRHGVEWRGQFFGRAQALQQRLIVALGSDGYALAHEDGALRDTHDLEIEALLIAQRAAQSGSGRTGSVIGHERLTAREQAVLRLLAEGKSDREIGADLFISPKTANRHVTNILAKLDCHNRTAATAKAFQHGLV